MLLQGKGDGTIFTKRKLLNITLAPGKVIKCSNLTGSYDVISLHYMTPIWLGSPTVCGTKQQVTREIDAAAVADGGTIRENQ